MYIVDHIKEKLMMQIKIKKTAKISNKGNCPICSALKLDLENAEH